MSVYLAPAMAHRVLVLVFIVLTLTGAVTRSDRPEMRAPAALDGAQEVDVVAVIVDERTRQPSLVLQGKRDHRNLVLVIGFAEATGIAAPLQGVTPPRPLTHDLFLTLFGRLKVGVTRVVINDLRGGVYYATLLLSVDGKEMTLDSRPSDAIALAIRAKAPVYVEDRVFEKSSAPGPLAPPGNRL